MPSSSLHGKALAWAQQHLGDTEVPPGSNTGPFVYSCQQATWLPGTRWPWCVAFFQKAWQTTGFKMPWLGAGAYAFLDWAKGAGWAIKGLDAVPGDAVILNIGAGHCAMLSEPVKDGKVPTISGNYGDKVAAHVFDISLVRGFIHIPADKTVPLPKPAKPPVFEVVTSASGKRKVVYVSGAKAISKHSRRSSTAGAA
jgi:hypothetical protein